MLAFRVRVRDLATPWTLGRGAWTAGESWISPYPHRALERHTIVAGDRVAFVVRARIAGSSAEPAAVRTVVPKEFAAAVEAAAAWPLDVVVVAIEPGGSPAVSVRSGTGATAPLYLVARGETLWGHWDPARLYGLVRGSIDLERVAYLLAMVGAPYSRRTLFPDLLRLTERARAAWHPNELTIGYPNPAPHPLARRLVPGADPLATFEEILAAALRRCLPDGDLAADLSGGLDSSAVVAVVARAFPRRRVRTYGLIVPGSRGPAQSLRRAEVVQRFGTHDTALPAGRFPPFSAGERDDDDLVVEWGEFYHEAFRELLAAVRRDDGDTIARGIGGDEISELHEGEVEARGATVTAGAPALPDYATPLAREAYRSALLDLDRAPTPPVAGTFYAGAAACAPLYLRCGVWPAYPYGAVELVNFARQLPVEWRLDRALQRRYLARCGLSQRVVNPDPPESFLALRDLGMRERCAGFVGALFRTSRLAAAGLVDADRLFRAYEHYRAGDERDADRLLKAAYIELTLRSVERASATQFPRWP